MLANTNADQPFEWHNYSARNSLRMDNQSATAWNEFYSRMELNQDDFLNYYNHYHRFSKSKVWSKDCDGKCKQDILAQIRVSDPFPK